MANNSGKRRSRTADMHIPTQDRIYQPPSCPPAEETVYPAELSPTDALRIRIRIYKGQIVDFAVTQVTKHDNGWAIVARIDCCHGTIHRHQFNRAGVDMLDHELITPIPTGDSSWAVVNDGYESAYTALFDEWESNLRRWHDGR